jgi:hypothetical protein
MFPHSSSRTRLRGIGPDQLDNERKVGRILRSADLSPLAAVGLTSELSAEDLSPAAQLVVEASRQSRARRGGEDRLYTRTAAMFPLKSSSI